MTEELLRRQLRLGLSQIVTRNMLLGFSFETIAEEGYLNNPYRSVRYLDSGSASGYSYQPEVYPDTRTSNAIAARSRYYLPYRAAVYGEYRYFTDTWGIDAHTAEVGYTHPYRQAWIKAANAPHRRPSWTVRNLWNMMLQKAELVLR